MPTRHAFSVALALSLILVSVAPAPALASETDAGETEERRRGVFPPRFKKKDKKSKAEEPAPEPEEVAVEASGEDEAVEPEGGILQWVDRMEGEIPSDEQLQALQESEAVEADEAVQMVAAERPLEEQSNDPLFLDIVDPDEFDIPIDINPTVAKWVNYFANGNGRKYYAKWMGRSSRYRPMMYEELEKKGMPRDLVYLSMIESGYNAHAYSHAAAAGLWQFIPSTGKLYKLRIDWWVDDRRDPAKALDAATTFLDELHGMFGDWRLAMSSYNAGPGRVRRAIRNGGTKDFWELYPGTYLPTETKNYVPQIMAAAIIGHHPERYGFTEIAWQDELVYDVSRVEGSVDLEVIAKCADTTVAEIKALNPGLRRYATPPEGYDVRVPKGASQTFAAALAKVPKRKRVEVVRHSIRKGETLSRIASNYGVSTGDLQRVNGLKNADRIYVGMSLMIPTKGMPAPTQAASSSRSTPAKTSTYTVRSGDSLSLIASRHGMSVDRLKSMNGLGSSTIHPGQRLKLTGSASTASSAGKTKVVYTVRSGDNLSKIAARHGVSTSAVQKWNNIGNASHITVGQKLAIYPASGWTTYTVRSGDSLGRIATRHGCSVTDLREWNGLSGTVIQPGQRLRIKS